MNRNLNWQRHRYAAMTILLGLMGWTYCSEAIAITPHPHTQPKVQYPNPLPGVLTPHSGGVNDANLSHVKGVGVKEIANIPSFPASQPGSYMVDNVATPNWNTYASWDNRTFRNGIGSETAYGHGYIDPAPGNQPRYKFGAGITGLGAPTLAKIQARMQTTWQAWQTAAKAQGEGLRTAPDGTALKTDLAFQDVQVAGGPAEISIDLITLPAGQFGAWNPNALTLNLASTISVGVFVDNPANSGTVNPDWQVSSDGLALGNGTKVFQGISPSINLPYNFTDAAPAILTQDIDYLCVKVGGADACGPGVDTNSQWEGSEAAFTNLGLNVADQAGGATAPAIPTPLFQADYLSLVIHEWGHALGLDHAPVGSTMATLSPLTLGVTNRTIDTNSAIGAAVLYSIPVPEPSSSLLLVIGIVTYLGCGKVARTRC